MQPRHYQALKALSQCTFYPGGFDKRFVRDLSVLSEYAMLTARQEEWIEKMLYRYRRQLGRKLAGLSIRGGNGEQLIDGDFHAL